MKVAFLKTDNLSQRERDSLKDVLSDIGVKFDILFVFHEKEIEFISREELTDIFEHFIRKLKEGA